MSVLSMLQSIDETQALKDDPYVYIRVVDSLEAVLGVVECVVLLAESLATVGAVEWLGPVMHLGHVLLQVGTLGEGLATSAVVANERALLGMRAQVVEELEDVGDDAVAAVSVLALEKA